MNALNKLKQRLLNRGSDEEHAVRNLCKIMEICGGYKQLMELPMTAIDPILKYLKFKQEQEDKKIASMFGKKIR